MAVELIDSFDLYNNTTGPQQKWTDGGGNIFTSGSRTGANHVGFGNTAFYERILDTARSTLIVGTAFSQDGIPAGNSPSFLEFRDGATIQASVGINNGGFLVAWSGGSATTIRGTSATPMSTGLWYHIQCKVVCHATTGSITVKLNDTTVITATGLNTAGSGTAQVNRVRITMRGSDVNGNAAPGSYRFDDFYLFNNLGAVNDDFGGDLKVLSALALGNGAVQNFSRFPPAVVSNVLNVKENPPNGDTDYNFSSTVGHIDLYTMTPIANAPIIKSVQVVNTVRKDDAGPRSICAEARVSALNYNGPLTYSPFNTYTNAIDNFDVNPNTALAWTQAQVNAAEFGLKVIV